MTTEVLPQSDRRWSVPELAQFAVVVLLLTGNFTGAVNWGYEYGGFPLKPRDFNLVLSGLSLALLMFNQPRFCIPALALITIPLVRFLDSAFLQRYSYVAFGPHSVYVLMIGGFLLVTTAAVLSLSGSRGPQTAVWVAGIAIVVNSAMNLYEYLGFATFTRIVGRMSGFHIDPNHSPIIICLMLGILFTFNKRYWWNMALVFIGAVGIALTMSRSGMAVFAVMTAIYVVLHFREHTASMITLAVVGVPLLAIGIGVMGATSTRQGLSKNEDTSGRMEAIYNLDFEKIKSPERAKDLADGWEAVTLRPITGYGTGAGSSQWQPHNQFVTHWIDLGLPGFLQYLGALLTVTIACALKRFRGGFCLIPVWLFIPCSQMLMDTTAYWYAFAVAALVVFPKRYSLTLRRPVSLVSPQHSGAHA